MTSSSDQPPPDAEPIPGRRPSDDPFPGSSPARTDPRARFLQEDLATLWPTPGQAELTGRRAIRPSDASSYAVVPTSRHPVLLLPTHPPAVAAATLRNYKTSAGSMSRAKFRALALAARAGALRFLPNQVLVHDSAGDPDADLVGHLRKLLGQEVYIAVYMGAPRANRKPVLQILGPDAQTIAFAKIGTNALTQRLVRREASALSFLATRPMTTVRVPSVLHHGSWHGHEILVQRAVGRERVRARALPSAIEQAMVQVAGLGGVSTSNGRDSSYWRQLEQRISELRPDPQSGGLKSALESLGPVAASTEISFGAWHGDWTPWNMLARGDTIEVWDWERFETDVPVGIDALHLALQREVSRDHRQARSAATALLESSSRLMAPFGGPRDAAKLVATLYLLDLGARYLKDGQLQAGAALGNLQTWLLPVVSDSSQRLRTNGP